jgi:ABC-type multidrug transport system fused ATPase/permease subunit
MQRINVFLAEENVPDWACSLTRPINVQNGHETPEQIGFENATLEWHSMERTKPTADVTTSAAQLIAEEDRHPRLDIGEPIPPPGEQITSNLADVISEFSPVSNGAIGGTRIAPVKAFKLQNLNVSLPLGELTLVTGITGAGKTAFLVALLGGKRLELFAQFV